MNMCGVYERFGIHMQELICPGARPRQRNETKANGTFVIISNERDGIFTEKGLFDFLETMCM